LKILKKLRTTSLNSEFTGSYKKRYWIWSIYLFRLQHNGSWIHIQPHLQYARKQQKIKQSENKRSNSIQVELFETQFKQR